MRPLLWCFTWIGDGRPVHRLAGGRLLPGSCRRLRAVVTDRLRQQRFHPPLPCYGSPGRRLGQRLVLACAIEAGTFLAWR